jgi:hypothetical protein
MNQAHVVERWDARRSEAEDFVRDVYARQYGAEIVTFAPRLLLREGEDGEILCVAGLRLPGNGFFSEVYLDEPVETALARVTGRAVRRGDVYEVTTLASRSPRDMAPFIDDIIGFGAEHGLSWAFFTLTQRLGLLVRRRGLTLLPLAEARADRVADAATWGSYYATAPTVYGVCGVQLLHMLAPQYAEARHAQGL